MKRSGFGKYAQLGMGAYALARKGLSMYSNRARGDRNRQVGGQRTRTAFRGSDAPVTNTFDVRRQYQSRRLTRQKRRRMKRFKNMSTRVLTSNLAQKVAVFYDATVNTTPVDTQFWVGWATYNPNNTFADLQTIFNDETAPSTNVPNKELIFKSCVMDIELVNTGASVMILDAYYVISRNNRFQLGWDNLQQSFTTAAGQVGTIGGGSGIALDATQLGVTPFDTPNFCEQWKILKKERLVLSPGQCNSFIVKDTKTRKMESDVVTANKILRGQKGILFVFSGAFNGMNVPPASLGQAVNWNYHYVENENTLETGGYHP